MPFRFRFVIENDNESHIIKNDDPMIYLEDVISSDFDRWLKVIRSEIDFIYISIKYRL